MASHWHRVNPGMAPPVGQIQAVAAKKHLTVFMRSPSAPGAGSPEQKLKFSKCAHETKDKNMTRMERNESIATCLSPKKKE